MVEINNFTNIHDFMSQLNLALAENETTELVNINPIINFWINNLNRSENWTQMISAIKCTSLVLQLLFYYSVVSIQSQMKKHFFHYLGKCTLQSFFWIATIM